jgi:pyrroline-5-carboxylate reductase
MIKIGLIGYGRLARALHQGLSSSTFFECWVSSPSLNASSPNLLTTEHNIALTQRVDCIILCVKPKQIPTVIQEIAPYLKEGQILVSAAAGVPLQRIQEAVPIPPSFVLRMMPNLAVAIQQGLCVLQGGDTVDERAHHIVSTIANHLGRSYWVEDDVKMNQMTALLGSGPAYVLEFMDAFINAGLQFGLPEQEARSLILDLVQGTVNWAKASTEPMLNLQAQVVSPGGTTEAALKLLHTQHWNQMLQEAIGCAYHRADSMKSH